MYNGHMDNQSQQIITYIQQHVSQGISEADVRNHLLSSGWPQSAVDQAFIDYHAAQPTQAQPSVSMGSQTVSKRHKPPIVKIIGGGILLVIIIIVLIVALKPSSTKKVVVNLAKPAEQIQAQDTSQKNDVAMIASGIAQYISNNTGALPTATATDPTANTLDICGTSCTGTSKETVTLNYFKNTPAAVSFHAYSSTLTAPDTATAYIVNNATCNSSNTAIGTTTTSPDVAILYEQKTGSGTQQQCLSE
jgi:hypothetical protein